MENERRDALFAQWESPMVRACLQGEMGRIVSWGEDSALAALGDFCFLAGKPASELIGQAEGPLLVPGNGGWVELIEKSWGERAVAFTRYAVRRTQEIGSNDRLLSFTNALPEGFKLAPIGKGLYPVLLSQAWSRDLCGNFRDEDDFVERGIGIAVLWRGEPVAGAASYAVCAGAIEIEIDTAPDFRRRGLALACGAKLILECLERDLYPAWDAHDLRSLALAEKLGYQLDHPYPAFWVEEKAKNRGEASRANST